MLIDYRTSTLSAPGDRRAATIAAAIGLLSLGVLSLAYRDTLLQWQPAPKDAMWRMPFALFSGVVLTVAGIGLLSNKSRRAAATLGAVWIALWVVVLHVPAAIASRGSVVSLLGIAECAAMSLGLGMIALGPEARRYRRVLVAWFGACALVFGLSHFVYADFTAGMVPDWLPARHAVAWVTGGVHTLTGLCMLLGVAMPLAAWVETMMMFAFVVLLHVPRVLAAPNSRLELTMLAVALMLTSAAWVVAASTRGGVRLLRGRGSLEPLTL